MAPDKISILAVDDEADVREVLERRLARAGYHCVTASSAGQAAQLLQGEAFALVLLDIKMPRKSGMEFLPEIIAQYPQTGVVMLTGVADTVTAVKAMRQGALAYVTKPLDLDELSIRIEHALAQHALSLQNRAESGLPREPGTQGYMVPEPTGQLEQRVRELKALNQSASMSCASRFRNPLRQPMAPDKISILAVDDEVDIQEVLERRLARAGYHCVTASSAGQAAQLLQGEAFALVLLDIKMPRKSGMEFLPEIIAQYPQTGVVMMTGVVDTVTAVKAMREGALDYVTKPFNLDELSIRIEHALAQRALSLQNRAESGLPREPGTQGYMLAERTGQLEQRVRELTALNRLFQEDLGQRFQVVVAACREVLEGLQKLAQETSVLVQHAQFQPLPDLKQVPLPDPEDSTPPPPTGCPAN